MYSEELQEATKKCFELMPIMAVKKFGMDLFGLGFKKDGKYMIVEHKTQIEYLFDSVDELLKAGWAMD